ncbi:unnamed protein product [Gadus morhua 'NCC']
MNRARIIFTVSSQNTFGQVFITQHYQASQGQGTVYDPVHTYQITINLLRELRFFSLDRRQHSELSEIGGDFGSSIGNSEPHFIRNTWGQLAQHSELSEIRGNIGSGINDLELSSITIDLLRELRVFSVDRRQRSELSEIGGNIGSGINDHELSSVRNTWGQLACVGLLLFIVINERKRLATELETEAYSKTIFYSINDLKKIPFGRSVPQHSLVLLHWFANTIELTNNNRLELNFDPDHGDYGAHPYRKFQGFLDPLPFAHRYFALGNINPMMNNQRRPSYFTNDLNRLLGREVLNRARIIFSYSSQDTVGQVFITQHYQANQDRGTGYDPVHTYRISINLLRELRVFPLDQRSHSELSEIGGHFGSSIVYDKLSSLRNTWGQLACVGLLLFIVINQRNVPCRPNRAREPKRLPEHNVQGSATPQMYNLQSYNNYRPPPQPRGEDQCLTVCLTLGFLARNYCSC